MVIKRGNYIVTSEKKIVNQLREFLHQSLSQKSLHYFESVTIKILSFSDKGKNYST